jgi:uncharacterized protein (UPF0333 family)
MAFLLVIIIIFAYIFISRVRSPEEKKPTTENSSMDIIKYSSQGNESNIKN